MSALPLTLRLTCCCCCWLLTCIVIIFKSSCIDARDIVASDNKSLLIRNKRYATRDIGAKLFVGSSGAIGKLNSEEVVEGIHEESDVDLSYDGEEDYHEFNTTERGKYLGSPCDDTCSPHLQHVVCDSITGKCECEKNYPVQIGPAKGCTKPKKLGEQCFYRVSCLFVDQHATCTQVQHNAVCDCDVGYHRVILSRPTKKTFCAEDLVLIKTDLSTLLGVASGIAVLTGLICFVLKLFSRARYSPPHHYANAHHAPPMCFGNDTGIPMTLSGRPSSRSSQRSDGGAGPLSCAAFTRRPSSGGSRGPLVPASRAGSRRPSLASIHSSTSSARSYSARRLEKERNEKEARQAMQELRSARQKEQEQQQQQQPTPSPRTPHSTDELLPSVKECREELATVVSTELPTVSRVMPQKIYPTTSTTQKSSIQLSIPSTSKTVYRSINANETAFTASSCDKSATTAATAAAAATTTTKNAFKKESAANCSSVVDIFES